MIRPKIYILLASCNREHFISETLNSLISQSYKDWTCLITDDNSSDKTYEIIKNYIKNDKRFQFYKKPPGYKKGLSGTRNFGLDLAKKEGAQFIQFFDDDDLMHPQKLELQIEPLLINKNLAFSLCKFEKLVGYEDGKWKKEKPKFSYQKPSHLGEAILDGNLIINSLGPLFRMEFIEKYRFDERLRFAEEWVLFIQMGFKDNPQFEYVDEYLFSYRKHQNSLTMGKDEDYEKRKSSAVSRFILEDYLYKNNLHTKKSIEFFAKTFLFQNYSNFLFGRLLNLVESNPRHFGKSLLFKLKISKWLREIFSRLTGIVLKRL